MYCHYDCIFSSLSITCMYTFVWILLQYLVQNSTLTYYYTYNTKVTLSRPFPSPSDKLNNRWDKAAYILTLMPDMVVAISPLSVTQLTAFTREGQFCACGQKGCYTTWWQLDPLWRKKQRQLDRMLSRLSFNDSSDHLSNPRDALIFRLGLGYAIINKYPMFRFIRQFGV